MKQWLPPLLVALSAALFLWWHSKPSQPQPAAAVPQTIQQGSAATPPQPLPANSTSAAPEGATNNPGDSPVVAASSPTTPSASAPVAALPPELATLEPSTVLENMRTSIRQYGAMFGGNPVGTNQEITDALQGNNPKHINFLKADGNRVNSQGELVDVWGTPYFFHQVSGTETEIRSAGPDRIMYTSDDLVIK